MAVLSTAGPYKMGKKQLLFKSSSWKDGGNCVDIKGAIVKIGQI